MELTNEIGIRIKFMFMKGIGIGIGNAIHVTKGIGVGIVKKEFIHVFCFTFLGFCRLFGSIHESLPLAVANVL